MRMKKLFMGGSSIALGSALALGAALTFATPASAQQTCGSGTAVNPEDLACGIGATATGGGLFLGATAVGSYSIALGSDASAFGSDANATGDNTTAVGSGASASQLNATAIGDGAVADNINSVALGAGSNTTADNQVQVGGRTINGVLAGAINATSTDAVNGAQINTILVNQAAVDAGQNTARATFVTNQAAVDAAQNALITGIAANSVYFDANSTGPAANAVGVNAIAIGQSSVANGVDSVAIGRGSTTLAAHTGSVALGSGTATTAANQVNVGGRTIDNVLAVTPVAGGTSAATTGQLFTTNSNVTALTTRVTAAEADIDTLFLNDIDLARQIGRTDRRASAGTAVAIAMGGAMFLPDKTFNLTGNVGVYRGSWAGAVNLGALIGSSAAFNAGIGKGINRNGKIGARAGFTFGW